MNKDMSVSIRGLISAMVGDDDVDEDGGDDENEGSDGNDELLVTVDKMMMKMLMVT